MKNNINKKVGATLLAAAIMAGTAVIPMSNAAVEKAAQEANKPSIEYIAHSEWYGWTQGWVKEGEMAGTSGESKRVEALKVRMTNCEGVSLKIKAHVEWYGDMEFTDTDELIGTVGESKRVEAITITSTGLKEKGYKLQYRVHIQDLGWSQGWVDEGEMAGTSGRSLRLEAIEIKVVPIDDVEDELATEKAKAIAEIEKYNDIIPNVEGLTAQDKSMLTTRIATAIANIKNAKTSEEITEIKEELTNLIEKYYGIELAKAEAIMEIKTYLEGASEGLTSYIEEQIEAINKETSKTKIATIQKAAVTECRAIITAQEYANEVFDIYSKTLNETEGLLDSEKTVIRSRINEDRANVAKAESAEEITGTDGIVKTFEAYMNGDTRYAEIVKSAEKAIEKATAENELKSAINKAISDFEASIEKTYKTDEEGMKLAKEYKAEYIEKLQSIKDASSIKTELAKVTSELKNKIKDTKKYTAAYKEAITALKNFERIVPTLELSNKEEIITYIEQTRAIVLEAKTASEINTAMGRFNAYMDSFDINVDNELNADEVKQVATTSKRKLNEYVNSNIDRVSQLAKDAIEEIDEIMEDETTATVKAIETALDKAMNNINNERLYAAQSDAYNKLAEYKKSDKKEVIEEAKKGIDAITKVQVGEDVEEDIKLVEEELAKALKEINKILGNVTADAREAFNKAKADLIAELREYRNMATELGDTAATKKANEYIDVITDMTYDDEFTIEDLKEKQKGFYDDINSSMAVKNKVTAIRKLQGYMEEENIYTAEKAQVNGVINRAIASIKAVKAPTDAEGAISVEMKMIDEIVDEVDTLREKYTALDTARNEKIKKLTTDRETATTAGKIEIDNKIKEIKAIVLNLGLKDDKANTYGIDDAMEKLTEIN